MADHESGGRQGRAVADDEDDVRGIRFRDLIERARESVQRARRAVERSRTLREAAARQWRARVARRADNPEGPGASGEADGPDPEGE